MRIKKNTWLLLLAATLMGGVVLYHEIIWKKDTNKQVLTSNKLFDLQEKNIQKIIIEKQNITLKFIKTNDRANNWKMLEPEISDVNNGTIAFLIDLFINSKPERTISLNSNPLSDYGLEQPNAKITAELNPGKTITIFLGKMGINPSFIYAKVINNEIKDLDPKIVLVSKNWQYAVDREFSEWIIKD